MSFVIAFETSPSVMAIRRLYATEADAQALVGSLTGYLIRPATWREREELRLVNGFYRPVPWDFPPPDGHYPHISKEDPKMVAFTENPQKGERDVQTRMRPGRYLQRFHPHLSPKQVAFYAEWFSTGQKPLAEVEGVLQINSDFVFAYKFGPSSCMKDMDCVRVYDAGDLKIAYVEYGAEIISRALVWPDRKVYGRIYPEPPSYKEGEDLQRRLRDLGYQAIEESEEGFEGARILKIEEEGNYIMPYIDRGYGVKDAGDHWTMSLRPDYSCQETSGYLYDPEDDDDYYSHCDDCGARVHNDNLYYAYSAIQGQHPVHPVDLCSDCYDNRGGFVCDIVGDAFVDVETIEVQHADGGTYISSVEMRDRHYVETPNGWCSRYAAIETADGNFVWKYGTFDCPITGRTVHYQDGIEIDGVWVAKTNQNQPQQGVAA